MNDVVIIVLDKKTSAAGFEPARVTPTDFESASLTTRTYWLPDDLERHKHICYSLHWTYNWTKVIKT